MRLHFAPLQGYTEAPYRRIHQQVCGGIDAYYTPFIRLEHGRLRPKDLREAHPDQNAGLTLVPQIIANGGDEFRTLAQHLIAQGHRQLDINMGCPFPLQTRVGRGSGILAHPDRVAEILAVARQLHEAEQVTFSIKMRLGQTSVDESMALLPMLNDTPLHHITLHPRVGVEQYRGELHLDAFDAFYQQSVNPLVFNGMLTTVDEMHQISERYPRLSGMMIGRGLLARPTLAAEYVSGQSLTDDECRRKVLQMHRLLFDHYQQAIEGGEPQLVQKMHSFWEYLEPLFGHKAIKKILKSGSLRNYREAVANVNC